MTRNIGLLTIALALLDIAILATLSAYNFDLNDNMYAAAPLTPGVLYRDTFTLSRDPLPLSSFLKAVSAILPAGFVYLGLRLTSMGLLLAALLVGTFMCIDRWSSRCGLFLASAGTHIYFIYPGLEIGSLFTSAALAARAGDREPLEDPGPANRHRRGGNPDRARGKCEAESRPVLPAVGRLCASPETQGRKPFGLGAHGAFALCGRRPRRLPSRHCCFRPGAQCISAQHADLSFQVLFEHLESWIARIVHAHLQCIHRLGSGRRAAAFANAAFMPRSSIETATRKAGTSCCSRCSGLSRLLSPQYLRESHTFSTGRR